MLCSQNVFISCKKLPTHKSLSTCYALFSNQLKERGVVVGIRMKYFPHDAGVNDKQAAAINAALVS